MNKKSELKLDINRARYNLLFFLLLSIINIYFIAKGGAAYIPYSSFIATYAIVLGAAANAEMLGYLLASIVLIILFVCFLFSKKSPLFFFIAFSIITADTLLLTVVMIVDDAVGILSIFNILMHLLNLFFIFVAIKIHKMIEMIPDTEANETNDEINDNSDEAEVTEYIDDGTAPLLSGKFNGLSAFAVIRNAKAELVINGFTCDALDVTHKSEFELGAVVNDIEFYFQYRRAYDGTSAFLYANDTLLDSIVAE